jgi:tetratricopeptide (TPR) repeat protein
MFNNRGNAWSSKHEFDRAIADFNEAIRLDPSRALFFVNRALAWSSKKVYDNTRADYAEALRLDPTGIPAIDQLAWLLATCPDPNFRDGKRAVELATRACELTEWKNAYTLGTLAAAFAELGDFAKAVEWQEKANRLYADPAERAKGEARLKLYQNHKPYRLEG